ncbi:MAG: ribulose-phosphate 3-epimerase [Synergistes sp.]|nr:ribulose-phosphate 3-epimerase [Synergistes sp.]
MARSLQLERAAKNFTIAPSLLSADILNMGAHIDSLKGETDWLHIDIMDGHFVPNLSYGPSLVSALRKRYPEMCLDVHIMAEPEEYFVDMFLAAKPDILTVHYEAAKHIHRLIQHIKSCGAAAGVSVNPGTSETLLTPVLCEADLVLVMSVNPGYGGQSFIPESLKKISALSDTRKANGYSYLIEADGGISPKNVASVASAGCNVAVAGSAVFGKPEPDKVVAEMKRLAGGKL